MWSMKRLCFLIFRLLFLLDGGRVGGVWSLRNVSISVPRGVLGGAGAWAALRCSYELEGAALYSLRWYRAAQEFYRYVPREHPPARVFPLPLPGAAVDLSRSDAQQVVIVGLHRRLSGLYQCEVSADAPLFHTDIRAANFTVVDPPFRAPRLVVSRALYSRGGGGGALRANCSADESYPAANITWLLDGHEIAEYVAPEPEPEDFRERASFSELELIVGDELAPGLELYGAGAGVGGGGGGGEGGVLVARVGAGARGELRLWCEARVLGVWRRAAPPALLREDAPRPASVTGDDDSSGSGARCSSSSSLAVCAGAALLWVL